MIRPHNVPGQVREVTPPAGFPSCHRGQGGSRNRPDGGTLKDRIGDAIGTAGQYGETQGEIHRRTANLRCWQFGSLTDDLMRGGLPRASYAEGPRGNEDPLPGFDNFDYLVSSVQRAYQFHLQEMLEHLGFLEDIEKRWIPPAESDKKRYQAWRLQMHQLAVEVESPRASQCANTQCGRFVERTAADPMRAGRCEACYKYRQRHDGQERPRALCEKDVERERTS